jgi:hypothetical protein
MYLPYVIPMFIVALFSITGTVPMMRTGMTILANWIAGTGFVYLTGIHDAWAFSLLLDALAARIILHEPAGKTQAMIGWTYMAQILLHVVYAFSNHSVGAYPYWQVLTAMAFVQLLLLGGWIGGSWYHRYFGNRRVTGRPSPSRHEGVAP